MNNPILYTALYAARDEAASLRADLLRANRRDWRARLAYTPRTSVNYRPLIFSKRGEVTGSIQWRGWTITGFGRSGSVRALYTLLVWAQRFLDSGRRPAALHNEMKKLGLPVKADMVYRQITFKIGE